jgi:hypothetical protein
MLCALSCYDPWKQREIRMENHILGIHLVKGGEAVRFAITVDGDHRSCLIRRETLNDLCQSNSTGEALEAEFAAHSQLISEKATMAIQNGMVGDPLLLPNELFFPHGRPWQQPVPE